MAAGFIYRMPALIKEGAFNHDVWGFFGITLSCSDGCFSATFICRCIDSYCEKEQLPRTAEEQSSCWLSANGASIAVLWGAPLKSSLSFAKPVGELWCAALVTTLAE